MSTKFTRSPLTGLVMVDSEALRLTQAIDAFRTRQTHWLLTGLATRGYPDLNATHLGFISVLDCDDNMASEVARRLNISRQAVHKTVRELEKMGYLTTAQNPELRNSRVIRITAQGEALVAAARTMFADLDAHLSHHLSTESREELHRFLQAEIPD